MSALIPRETLTDEPQPVRLPVLMPVRVVEGLRDVPVVMNARTLNAMIEAGLLDLRDFGVGEEDGDVMTIEQIVTARTA